MNFIIEILLEIISKILFFCREKPRGVEGVEAEQFRNRKLHYSLNVQVIGDAYQRILDLDCRYPGSAHDSRIWNQSAAKPYLAGRPWYLAGDAGYPLSATLIKPFPNPVGKRQRLFNIRLSGARTVMTENIFGIWKRRFPVLTNMRFHHEKAMKVVVATAVLHNFAIEERDLDVDEFAELPRERIVYDNYPNIVVEDHRPPEQVRAAGQDARQQILLNMQGPRTWNERAA